MSDIYEFCMIWLKEWYSDVEFTAGGLLISSAGLIMFAFPFLIFAIEYFSSAVKPSASLSIPLPPPTKVKEIRIYPIKSCRGFTVQKAKLIKSGLDLDRNWMFVDAKTMKFLTIRQNSSMTLIETKLNENDELEVSVRDKKDLSFKIPAHPSTEWLEANTKLINCEIWGQKVDAWVYDEEMTAPYSAFFNEEVRFVYKGPTPRVLKGNAAPSVLGRKESTKFADVMPVQVSNQKSMDELNFRLKNIGEETISIERFRPNIVIEGDEPWSEDVWKTIKLGGEKDSIVIDVAARCARCQVPNVDPETAVKNKREPWTTLMDYRRIDKGITFKPIFGMLCVPRAEGEVSVGMEFDVMEVTEQHEYMKAMG